MTTTVTITSLKPNHNKVGVQVVHPSTEEKIGAQIVLDDGESTTVYVHDGSEVRLTEILKESA